MRSIGDNTHSPAIATTTLTRRGTRGSLRSVRAVVTHAGNTEARSFARPGGSGLANTIITIQDTAIAIAEMRNQCSNMHYVTVRPLHARSIRRTRVQRHRPPATQPRDSSRHRVGSSSEEHVPDGTEAIKYNATDPNKGHDHTFFVAQSCAVFTDCSDIDVALRRRHRA